MKKLLTSFVGAGVGAGVGLAVGTFVGAGVGGFEGAGVGCYCTKSGSFESTIHTKFKNAKS